MQTPSLLRGPLADHQKLFADSRLGTTDVDDERRPLKSQRNLESAQTNLVLFDEKAFDRNVSTFCFWILHIPKVSDFLTTA